MKEIWKDMVGYEDYFEVSNFGRVFSKRSRSILKLNLTGNSGDNAGYLAFVTRLNGRGSRSISIKVHQQVAKAFLDSPSEEIKAWASGTKNRRPYVNHKDGNKHNNKVSNLEWCTSSENLKHYHDKLKKTPTRHCNGCSPSLKDEEVLQIRDLSEYGFSERAIAKMYSVSRSSVNAAKNRYRWVS